MLLCLLQGVRWVLEMYAMGACEDWRYSFEHKAPGVQALQQYLQEAIALQGHGQDAVTFVPPVRVQQLQVLALQAMVLLGLLVITMLMRTLAWEFAAHVHLLARFQQWRATAACIALLCATAEL